MGLLFTIILVTLACIIFALRGVFGDFPAEWEWVGMVLAGAGILMAAPTLFQMLWGRPQLKTRFETEAQGSERLLVVFLENRRITSPIAKRLGVRRETIRSLTAHFRISEAGSGTIIIPICQARIYSDEDATDTGRDRIPLPPTFSVAASIPVARWDNDNQRVAVPQIRAKSETVLLPGHYRADIIFMVDGDEDRRSRHFTVGTSADDLKWCTS